MRHNKAAQRRPPPLSRFGTGTANSGGGRKIL